MTHHHRDRHDGEFSLGADTVLYQIRHLTDQQKELALLYMSGMSEETFARVILAARNLTDADPVEYLRREYITRETSP